MPLTRLILAQALYVACSLLSLSLAVPAMLATGARTGLASLPLALSMFGAALAAPVLAGLMQQRGNRAGPCLGAASGVVAGLLAFIACARSSVPLLCLASLLFGVQQAGAGFHRFLALEQAGGERRGQVLAWVVGAGVLAVLLTPPLLSASGYVRLPLLPGGYALIAMLSMLAWGLLAWLPAGSAFPRSSAPTASPPRIPASSGRVLILAMLGQGAMALGMGLLPLLSLRLDPGALPMPYCGGGPTLHEPQTSSTLLAMQWHLLGMYLPAVFVGRWLDRHGSAPVAWSGFVLLLLAALIGLGHASAGLLTLMALLLGAGANLVLMGTTLLVADTGPNGARRLQGRMEGLNALAAGGMALVAGLLHARLGALAVGALLLAMSACGWLLVPWQRPPRGGRHDAAPAGRPAGFSDSSPAAESAKATRRKAGDIRDRSRSDERNPGPQRHRRSASPAGPAMPGARRSISPRADNATAPRR